MMIDEKIQLYNTLTRKVVDFKALALPKVGIYWCGPTAYASPHLGHARSAVVLDTLVRTLKYVGYEVCTVRNITDVGHMLEGVDKGEDKVGKAARLAKVNPMEVVQYYTNEYHAMLAQLGTLPVQIEPRATGHITEQIALAESLLETGFAYEVGGSVYFDVYAFNAEHRYGKLSGRNVEEQLSGTRSLLSTSEKRSPLDFALWKKAAPDHLMQWPSPWGKGFPGWHAECTAMSHAYLGLPFDIHGGGIDLSFPHHECEIAQAEAAYRVSPARYWVHHNLVTLEGRKMSKSANHSISLVGCLKGSHPLLSQSYHPMAVRLLLLQAHYRSPLDLSDHALQAAQKGYYKLINGIKALKRLEPAHQKRSQTSSEMDGKIVALCRRCEEDLCLDLNTPKVIAHLFELLKYIHRLERGDLSWTALSAAAWRRLKKSYISLVQDVLGLEERLDVDSHALLEVIIASYREAKARKDYGAVDEIRKALRSQGISLQDRDGKISWKHV